MSSTTGSLPDAALSGELALPCFASTPACTVSHITDGVLVPSEHASATKDSREAGAGLMQHLLSSRYAAAAFVCIAASTVDASPLRAVQGGNAGARPIRLTGRVHDAVGSAIVKAEILVTETTLRAETDSGGRFELTGLPSGAVEVVVRRLGFSPAKIALDLGDG